jgi:glycosyltransferase involved in cell wall biosynthesis
MVESVLAQTYEKWELCIVHGYLDDQVGRDYLLSVAARDSRVKVDLLEANYGIAGNSNAALNLVTGDFIGLLDHDDTLAPFALFEMANAINEQPDATFLYSDKDCISEDGQHRLRPLFKPSWSPDIMLSVNYLTHFCVFRMDHLRALGGWRAETDGAQDWDIFLRLIDLAPRVVFVPGIHYHWRLIATSVAAGGLEAKPYAAKGQLRAVNDHLDRRGLPSRAVMDRSGNLRMVWAGTQGSLVSVILLSSDADGSAIQDRARRVDAATVGRMSKSSPTAGTNRKDAFGLSISIMLGPLHSV